tara:strand:+ start:217 stop:435 length:219 start_codon:yes stop_codon:yes gene_type:complete
MNPYRVDWSKPVKVTNLFAEIQGFASQGRALYLYNYLAEAREIKEIETQLVKQTVKELVEKDLNNFTVVQVL